jgi:hypothetical protein
VDAPPLAGALPLLLRLVLIFLICYIVFCAVRIAVREKKTKSAARRKFSDAGEEMVLDPQCRSYVPKSEAVVVSGQHFCSQECARLYLSR